ncbi:hypothetical protein [Streptomyces acidicola]|uniref:Uncharacterized protein n=1 Tax=Streptomyces acidicola TaxID=2596892 RepID=A0A5N8WIC0_9ACTN|nr:hypothetical protein [Streptomyces acidicola]MPY47081.1 hypothetical protein [Streptomyces acidicola]MPY47220.1 hypothetical protein [Streptomyces acidicola]
MAFGAVQPTGDMATRWPRFGVVLPGGLWSLHAASSSRSRGGSQLTAGSVDGARGAADAFGYDRSRVVPAVELVDCGVAFARGQGLRRITGDRALDRYLIGLGGLVAGPLALPSTFEADQMALLVAAEVLGEWVAVAACRAVSGGLVAGQAEALAVACNGVAGSPGMPVDGEVAVPSAEQGFYLLTLLGGVHPASFRLPVAR